MSDTLTGVAVVGSANLDLVVEVSRPPHVTAFRIYPVDTTGAGDAFCGALAAALAVGDEIESVGWRSALVSPWVFSPLRLWATWPGQPPRT